MIDIGEKLMILWILNSYFLRKFKLVQKIKLYNWGWSLRSEMSAAYING